MNLLEEYKSVINSKNLFTPKDKLLIAVSGGVDSVVLCELCQQAGFDFVIAHCNFKLRGEESERDEQFVIKLGKKYGVEVFVKQFDTNTYSAQNKLSTQEAARKLRYDWFEELTNNRQYAIGKTSIEDNNCQLPVANWLLTAHHADDNNETLLMNFFRGTGLHGLTGIPEKTGYIRRPLLSFTKEELLDFAKENKLDYVEDSSNQSSKYTRNYFRNELIPAVSKVYPQVNENLHASITRFKEIEKLYQLTVGHLKNKLCRQKGNELHIPVKQLLQYDNRALIYEIISPYGFTEKQVDEVIKLAVSDSGKYCTAPAGNYRIIKHRHWFIISPVQATAAANIIIEETNKDILFALGQLLIETTTVVKPSAVNNIATLSAKEINFPLLLRKCKTGDYFYPLGMRKKKKINRFLMDLKLSKTEKDNVWVVESNQRIMWVVGYRIDDRFKITDTTKELLRLEVLPAH